MDPGNHDVNKKKIPDPKIQSPRPEPDWREIAEEASKEHDSKKLMELANQLIDAFDSQEGAP